MNRDKAIDLLCGIALEKLSIEERMSFILDWWSIDETDPEFGALPPSLQEKMKSIDESELENVSDSQFNPLIQMGLRAKYIGVCNSYLEKRLHNLGVEDHEIEGMPEELHPCPCCFYNTLSVRGEYEICPVCYWEDSGDIKPEDHSGPNRMSLQEAQTNFAAMGAISSTALRFVDPEGKDKWRIHPLPTSCSNKSSSA